MGSIQRGDILVFSGDSDGAGHVGIYLGGGKMVDASSSEGQVRQSSPLCSTPADTGAGTSSALTTCFKARHRKEIMRVEPLPLPRICVS